MQSQENNQTPLLKTMDEAASDLSVSRSTLRRLILNGSLKTVRPSIGTVRISSAELERFAKEAPGTSGKTSRDCPPCGDQV